MAGFSASAFVAEKLRFGVDPTLPPFESKARMVGCRALIPIWVITIKTIISAWYLGYTGKPLALRVVDNTRFVTYTDALMYGPTLDAIVIPTYSRGHTNYWTQPPASMKND